jgi:hypothetical protein
MRCAALVVLCLLAAPALAKPDYPAKLDAACRSQGRTPPNPAELARLTGVAFADCALCHDFDVARGRLPSGSNDNAAGAAYKRGNLDPFCVLAQTNQAPVLAPIGAQSVNEGQPLGLLLAAGDADGDPVAFSATGVPPGAVFMDAGNGMASFDWTPAQAGNVAVTFTVSDGMASDSERVVITVGAVNAPPVLAPIGDQTVTVGETLVVALSATDPDGGPVAFSAPGLPAEAMLDDFGDGSAELTFAPSAPGVAEVTVSATDAGAPPETTSETFTLTALAESGAAGPSLVWAAWNFWESELSLKGNGAERGSLVTIVEPGAEGALAVTRAGDNGGFQLSAKTFLAPCFVRARSADGVLGGAIGVMHAPKDCGSALMTRARARYRCEDERLVVRGGRGPASSDVTVIDAADGATLMQGQTDRRGRYKLGLDTATPPANVRVRFASGAGEWTLGPVPVADADVACEAKEDDD